MKYTHLFFNEEAFNELYDSNNYAEPWISTTLTGGGTGDEYRVNFNDPLNTPLTFDVFGDGEIVWKSSSSAITRTIRYSKDNGKTWTTITSSSGDVATRIPVAFGDVVRFKGTNSAYANNVSSYVTFSGTTCKFSARGNVMSLINSTNFRNIDTVNPLAFLYLFRDCNTLINATDLMLPATTISNTCYAGMFMDCKGLVNAPSILPAPELKNYCYQVMFRGCISLVTAPEMPATTLAQGCCATMFSGCTNLEQAPELPASTLANYCYQDMFRDCSKLNYIKCLATNISAAACTAGWVQGVATAGTFVEAEGMTGWTVSVNGKPANWVLIGEYQEKYFTFTTLESGTFKFSGTTASNTLNYSLDSGKTWISLAHNTNTPVIESGNSIMWKGNLTRIYGSGSGVFSSTCKFNAEGNVMSLFYGDDFQVRFSLANQSFAFANLFKDNANIVNAANMSLPATTLSHACYDCMFTRCTNLITAPKLPATTLALSCYGSMFAGCSKLLEAPQLPSITLAQNCYISMFSACTSLSATPELPASTLTPYCYCQMFSGCRNLVQVPSVLLATTLVQSCYSIMFRDCVKLTTAPVLCATTLGVGCCNSMFRGCTGLTTAPVLSAPTLVNNCYAYMFSGCTSLNQITCLATDISAENCTIGWVLNISSSGTFIKAPSMITWTTGENGVPTNWTVQDAT